MDFLFSRIPLIIKFVAFIFIWLAETWHPMFKARLDQRWKHAFRNISIAVINVLLLGLFVRFITTNVCAWAQQNGYGLLNQLNWPLWTETILAVFMIDAWMYVWHRANHRIGFLWRFHRMHHTDLALDVTSASRFHPGELLFSAILRTGLIPVFGLMVHHVVIYEFVLMPIILFHHSNIAIPEKWDKCLRWMIVTPRIHWVHHSNIQNETDSNYSSICPVWDRLARTLIIRRDPEKIVYGISDERVEKNQTIKEMLETPLI